MFQNDRALLKHLAIFNLAAFASRFLSVSDHFGSSSIKGLSNLSNQSCSGSSEMFLLKEDMISNFIHFRLHYAISVKKLWTVP